jgi:hypothetical protein
MVNNEEIYGNNLGGPERHDSEEGIDQVSPPKIIYLESGRKTLEKARLENEEDIARLLDHSRLTVRLADNRIEFLVTMVMFFALLVELYVGLIRS